jgi:hypothetical protein
MGPFLRTAHGRRGSSCLRPLNCRGLESQALQVLASLAADPIRNQSECEPLGACPFVTVLRRRGFPLRSLWGKETQSQGGGWLGSARVGLRRRAGRHIKDRAERDRPTRWRGSTPWVCSRLKPPWGARREREVQKRRRAGVREACSRASAEGKGRWTRMPRPRVDLRQASLGARPGRVPRALQPGPGGIGASTFDRLIPA